MSLNSNYDYFNNHKHNNELTMGWFGNHQRVCACCFCGETVCDFINNTESFDIWIHVEATFTVPEVHVWNCATEGDATTYKRREIFLENDYSFENIIHRSPLWPFGFTTIVPPGYPLSYDIFHYGLIGIRTINYPASPLLPTIERQVPIIYRLPGVLEISEGDGPLLPDMSWRNVPGSADYPQLCLQNEVKMYIYGVLPGEDCTDGRRWIEVGKVKWNITSCTVGETITTTTGEPTTTTTGEETTTTEEETTTTSEETTTTMGA